jgi:RNA polymerase sigma factor (sigma-70 family)
MTALAAELRPSDQGADDLDLVFGVRAGDDRAFEVLYARYQPRIALYVRGMVNDHGRAEDITQEVFLSALRRMRETQCEIAVKPWLYEIAKNACVDAFRRSRHTNEVSFDATDQLRADEHRRLADAHATPHHAVDTKLDLDNLCGAFGGLSETHHQILVMRELEGLSYRDIGDRLGMSRPVVESTLFRARRRLEEEYGELVSGKRCVRVRAIIDTGGRAPGVRDQRRLDRHISHCQPCRRHALAAGIDLETRPARPSVAARIAALLPLPALWRRPGAEEAPASMLASPGHANVAHWSANVASTVDPATIGGWGKAVLTAATVALAGMGAGAAIDERGKVREFFSHPPVLGGGEGGSAEPGARGAAGSSIAPERAASAATSARGNAAKGGRSASHAPGRPSAAGGAARPGTAGARAFPAPAAPPPTSAGCSTRPSVSALTIKRRPSASRA